MQITAVQRKVLKWMKSHGGEMVIVPGHKTVALGKIRIIGTPAIGGNVNLLDGLKSKKLIEFVEGSDMVYRLTSIAENVLARMRTK